MIELFNICDRESMIKELFHRATNHTIEECIENPELAKCMQIDAVVGWSFSDNRNNRDFLNNYFWESDAWLAYQLARPIKERIDYYDLICCSLPYIREVSLRHTIYREIIYFTKRPALQIKYSERLAQELNEAKRRGIAQEILHKIKSFEKLPLNEKGEPDFCRMYISDFKYKSGSLAIEFRSSYYAAKPWYIINLKFNECHISEYFGEYPAPIIADLTIYKCGIGIKVEVQNLQFDGNQLEFYAKDMEVVSCEIDTTEDESQC